MTSRFDKNLFHSGVPDTDTSDALNALHGEAASTCLPCILMVPSQYMTRHVFLLAAELASDSPVLQVTLKHFILSSYMNDDQCGICGLSISKDALDNVSTCVELVPTIVKSILDFDAFTKPHVASASSPALSITYGDILPDICVLTDLWYTPHPGAPGKNDVILDLDASTSAEYFNGTVHVADDTSGWMKQHLHTASTQTHVHIVCNVLMCMLTLASSPQKPVTMGLSISAETFGRSL